VIKFDIKKLVALSENVMCSVNGRNMLGTYAGGAGLARSIPNPREPAELIQITGAA